MRKSFFVRFCGFALKLACPLTLTHPPTSIKSSYNENPVFYKVFDMYLRHFL